MGKRGHGVSLAGLLHEGSITGSPDMAKMRLHRIVTDMEQMLGERVSLHEMTAWVASTYCATAIRRAGGDRGRAAQLLGVHRNTLSRIMSKVGR